MAIQEEKIVSVGKKIPKVDAKKVLDLKGKILAPGLIDIHCPPGA